MMKFKMKDRQEKLFLFTVVILFVLVSVGCSQSNKSKIVGNWKTTSIDNNNGSLQYVYFNFYKEGHVSKSTRSIIDDQLSREKDKKIGKYEVEKDKNYISISWENGNTETMNVNFPQNNKMFLGKYEMEKIK